MYELFCKWEIDIKIGIDQIDIGGIWEENENTSDIVISHLLEQ